MSRVFNLSCFVTRNLSGFIVTTKEKMTKWARIMCSILVKERKREEGGGAPAPVGGSREGGAPGPVKPLFGTVYARFTSDGPSCGGRSNRNPQNFDEQGNMTRIRLDANAAAAQVWGVLTDFASCLRTIPADATEN